MYGLHKGLFRSLCKATKFFEMVNKHHKDAFDRISEERRERILEVGTEEFSSKGYENANINVIAKNAGISIGLMYKYFATKEDLFITCIQRGMRILSQVIEEIMASDDQLLGKGEQGHRPGKDRRGQRQAAGQGRKAHSRHLRPFQAKCQLHSAV